VSAEHLLCPEYTSGILWGSLPVDMRRGKPVGSSLTARTKGLMISWSRSYNYKNFMDMVGSPGLEPWSIQMGQLTASFSTLCFCHKS